MAEEPRVPAVIERFVKALVVAHKAVMLYPPASTIPRDTSEDAVAVLREAFLELPELRLGVTKNGIFYLDLPVYPDHPAYTSFALELYNRKLADVRFHSGTEARDIVSLLSILKYEPEEIDASGGFESRLWELGVSSVTVTEANVAVVDGASLAARESDVATAPPLTRQEIDDMLAAAYGGRPRDQLTVARFLSDPRAVSGYLHSISTESGLPDLMGVGERFAEFAEIAYEAAGPEGRHGLIQSLGQALDELDPDLRRALLMEEILPEARTNDALAAVVRQMDVDSVCRMLVEELDVEGVSREGLARAIRNLALISMADRDEVVAAAGAAMVGAGLSEGAASEVLEMAAPSRLTVRERTSAAAQAERPADAIFKLMDMAPTPQRTVEAEEDPGIAALREEARRGVTDGDVIMALVSLVAIDPRESQFASTMAMLEDSLDLLISRGEIDIAADSADALAQAAENPELSPEQQRRLRKAVTRFSKTEDVKAMARALRLYRPGSAEYEGARRLIEALGPLAIEPLLEQLADEQDMTARKALVDLLSNLAPRYTQEFGEHVGDSRWYVVRNVVSILGSTKSSATLNYLQRTIRHPEPRVRRETVRALSGINDRLAHEMLIATLEDDDAQNVQLAARYLGMTGVRGAVPSLEQVARGEGRGNRDTAPRVEAIEALGRLGAVESLPTLEALAGKRSIIGASRARELRAAAESAIVHVRQGGAR